LSPLQPAWDTATPNRRLDDRIRDLSNRAVTASHDELEPILQELLAAVREKLDGIRKIAADHYIKGKAQKDRRGKPESATN
jgi:hypothetical protein